jgi:N-acetylmuramoyl-L-alanine amidase
VNAGFLSNPEEAQNLSDPVYQKKIACAVLGAYLTKHGAGT